MSRPRILSVGQCSYDHGQISRQLDKRLGAEVVAAETHEDAIRAVKSGGIDLVMVNRVGDRDGAEGLDLIRSLKGDPATAEVPVMLVSNYDWAQNEAVALGALPGFGKAQLASGSLPQSLESLVKARS